MFAAMIPSVTAGNGKRRTATRGVDGFAASIGPRIAACACAFALRQSEHSVTGFAPNENPLKFLPQLGQTGIRRWLRGLANRYGNVELFVQVNARARIRQLNSREAFEDARSIRGRGCTQRDAAAEFLVVAEAVDEILFQPHENDAAAGVHFGVGRQPDFLVDFVLLEDEIRAFGERGYEAAADFHRVGAARFEAHDFAGIFIDPHGAGKFLDDAVDAFFRLVVGIAVYVEGDHIVSAKGFAARIGEKLGAEEIGEIGFVLFLFLGLLFGIGGELGLLLFQLVVLLVEFVVFVLFFAARERLAVLGEQVQRLFVADVEDVVVLRLARFHVAVGVDFVLFFGEVAGVLAAEVFQGLLILDDVAQKSGNIGQRARIRAWLRPGLWRNSFRLLRRRARYLRQRRDQKCDRERGADHHCTRWM